MTTRLINCKQTEYLFQALFHILLCNFNDDAIESLTWRWKIEISSGRVEVICSNLREFVMHAKNKLGGV